MRPRLSYQWNCMDLNALTETVLTRIQHREYGSVLGKPQWLQLQSLPDLSHEVNGAAQRSSAPTIADARALNAVAPKV